MKKTIVTITGANLDKEFAEKITKFTSDPKLNCLVIAPKTGFGSNVKVGIQQIDVKFSLVQTIMHRIFGL